MKRNIFLFVLTFFTTFVAIAQDIYEYDVRPEELISKEVILKGPFERDELKIMLGVKWWEIDQRIQLVFDRKNVSSNDAFLLFFPFFNKKTDIKGIVDCKFKKKNVWTKSKSAQLKYMTYFLESDHLYITNFSQCYRSLASNNEEEFEFMLKNVENEFKISLNGLYIARSSKRPWYTFSKRDKKLEFKVQPIDLLIRMPVVEPEKDVCEIAAKVVPYISVINELMLKKYDELIDAQKKQNCALFGLIKDSIRRVQNETNEKCEKYTNCETIASALKAYNDKVESALREECKTKTGPTAACTLSESELSAINNRLKNLQMKINVKKKDGDSTAEELREFQSIKNAVNPNLTTECRKKYKNLIDAYNSYCTVIEGLLK